VHPVPKPGYVAHRLPIQAPTADTHGDSAGLHRVKARLLVHVARLPWTSENVRSADASTLTGRRLPVQIRPSIYPLVSRQPPAVPQPTPADIDGTPLVLSLPDRVDVVTMFSLEGLLTGHTLLDRYRVGEVLGRGGMGVVYRARDLKLNRDVALKVLTLASADATTHQQLRARLAREARVAGGIQHPNVVAVYDHGTDPSLRLDFLTMELLHGEDLATRLRRVGFPRLESAFRVIREAAAGLAAGHRAGLVHRDVKPANLFLTSSGALGSPTVKVLDFGIAQGMVDMDWTLTHADPGVVAPHSPAFASPEQLRGGEILTSASDVFSLGAVAFNLLTGRRVFRTPDGQQTLREVQESVTALRQEEGLPPRLVDVLERALAPFPEERFTDAAALLVALEAEIDPAGSGAAARLLPVAVHLDPIAPEAVPPSYAPAIVGSSPSRTAAADRTPLDAAPAVLLVGSWVAGASLLGESAGGVLVTLAIAAAAAGWLVTSMTGRRDGLRFAVLATLALTAVAMILVGGAPGSVGAFAAVCIVQLLMSIVASWMGSPPEPQRETASDAESAVVDSW
jgi:tRNA A-37 threonylcarbamoyl transferase component Bud32